jgi:GNAT superfamily N-acetyltransferase
MNSMERLLVSYGQARELLRPSVPEDEAFRFLLFATDMIALWVEAGLSVVQAQSMAAMQYRGRQMSYATKYPDAEDWILLGLDKKPLGRLLLDRKPDCWRIVDFAVLAEERNKGWGSKALEECQQWAAAAGARMALQVSLQNPARRLYARKGFQVIRTDVMAVEMNWCAAQ